MGYRRLPLALALFVCAALALLLAVRPLPAAASTIADLARRAGDAPDYALEGLKWSDRALVDVYYTWAGGACVLDGDDLGSTASTIAPALAVAQLQGAIDEINTRLRGALRLSLAGETTRAVLCGKAKEFAIVVGWGTFPSQTEAGKAAMYSLRVASGQTAPMQLARVFVKNTLTFACAGPDPQQDLRHILTHELLHTLGVGHSSVPDAVMAPSSTLCRGPATLQPDDIAALTAIYPPPPGAAPGTPTTPASAAAGIAAFASTPAFSAGGQALAVFLGGSVVQLEAVAGQARATGVWAQDAGGVYYLDVIGGPAFVNAAFRTRFAAGFSGPTAVTLTR